MPQEWMSFFNCEALMPLNSRVLRNSYHMCVEIGFEVVKNY